MDIIALPIPSKMEEEQGPQKRKNGRGMESEGVSEGKSQRVKKHHRRGPQPQTQSTRNLKGLRMDGVGDWLVE